MYGAEHLLRLFVKLPELLAAAVATEQQASQVAIMVQVCARSKVGGDDQEGGESYLVGTVQIVAVQRLPQTLIVLNLNAFP